MAAHRRSVGYDIDPEYVSWPDPVSLHWIPARPQPGIRIRLPTDTPTSLVTEIAIHKCLPSEPS